MRTLLSLLLLATLGMPLWAPLLALGQAPEASLPACCRRDGKHHCAMGMAVLEQTTAPASQAPRWDAPCEHCPYCPGAVSSSYHPQAGTAAPAEAVFGYGFAAPQGRAQTESKRRIARDRSREKRGPPRMNLA